MKAIGELLEGLIPYSQRHYSRIDRLVRSTFLLDYTLTGMSVIEPETNDGDATRELKESPVIHDIRITEDEDPKQKHNPAKSAVKKRKSDKQVKDCSRKKFKDVGVKSTTVAAIS